jgi:flagellar motility protein MotE (MotC chaperone)
MLVLRRLLFSLIAILGLTLSVRLGALWHEAGMALAESTPPAASAPTNGAKPAGAKPEDAKPDAAAPEGGKADPAAGGDPIKPTSAAAAKQKFSPAEVELLQGLSKRRTELDQRSDELDQRELLLKAAEQRVQEKIDKLQQMQAQIDTTIGKVDEQEDERLKSLVHIYETMKPAEAARVFEQLDMPVLLQLMTRMKDQKTAPIMAAMAVDKAKALTLALAERKQVADSKTN